MNVILMLLTNTLLFGGWSTMGDPESGKRMARTTVSCPVSGDWGDKIAFREARPMAMLIVYSAQYRDGMIHLPVFAISGEGTLQVPGSPLLHVEWEKERCTFIEEPPPREVCGVVQHGGPWAVVNAISASGMSHAVMSVGGKFCARVAEEGPLALYANRLDGSLVTTTELKVEAPTEQLIIQMPKRRQGGLGVLASQAEDGWLVVDRVVPDMAAARAGIAPGDTIQVSEPVTGDVGSRVRIERRGEQGTSVVELKRGLFTEDPTIVRILLEDGSMVTTNKIEPHQVMF